MTRSLVAALAAAPVMLGLAVGPASAATVTQRDPLSSSAPSSFDLRRLVYENGARQLVIKLDVRNLRDTDTFVQTRFSTRAVRESGQNFVVTARRDRGGRGFIDLGIESRESTAVIPCRNLSRSFNLRTDRITMRVPQFCLGEGTGTQRLTTSIGVVHRTFDTSKPIGVRRR